MSAESTAEANSVNPIDGVHLIRNYILHCRLVRSGIQQVRHELERRELHHDDSKMTLDEFAGFTRINAAAREHPFGSEEYREGLRREKPVIDLHYSRNSHHPEFHGTDAQPKGMGWLDIVEMVCDWRGAYLAYGSQGSWQDNMEKQKQRYAGSLSAEQWWLVDQVARFLCPCHTSPGSPAGDGEGD